VILLGLFLMALGFTFFICSEIIQNVFFKRPTFSQITVPLMSQQIYIILQSIENNGCAQLEMI